ncbi:MAG TPA: hypothetical protein PK957_04455 [Candidatus Dojkabacteria bacterium]|nr:hypothetical protein [Candidatus Dojkabacteria bacterium]
MVKYSKIFIVLKGERRRGNCILCNSLGQWFLLDGNNIQEPRVAVQYRLGDSGLVSTIRVKKHWGPNFSEDYTPVVVFILETVEST